MRLVPSFKKLALCSFLALAMPIAGCASQAEDTDSSNSDLSATVTLDADSYPDRIDMLARVIAEHPFPKGTSEVWDDPRGGVKSLTGWQHRSGRSQQRWWQNTNRVLNVWVMQILQKHRGEFPNVVIAHPSNGLEPTADIVAKVLAFVDAVDAAHRDVQPGMSNEKQLEIFKNLLHLNWVWHTAALDYAFTKNEGTMTEMPPAEQTFAHSWAFGMLPIMTAAEIETSATVLDTVIAKSLPPRLAEPQDYSNPAGASDLAASTRSSMIALRSLDAIETKSKHKFSAVIGKLAKKTSIPFDVSKTIQESLEAGSSAPKALLKGMATLAGESFLALLGHFIGLFTSDPSDG